MPILDDLKLQYRTGGIVQKLIFWNVGVFILSLVFSLLLKKLLLEKFLLIDNLNNRIIFIDGCKFEKIYRKLEEERANGNGHPAYATALEEIKQASFFTGETQVLMVQMNPQMLNISTFPVLFLVMLASLILAN